MTVASSTNRVDYTGNGSTTVFSFTFRIFAATDLVVTKADADGVETVLTLNTDYTVTGVGSYSGGTVTISPALSSDYDLTIQRVLPLTQETDLRNQGQFFAETHEDVFDRMSMINQQLQEQLDRAAKLPVTNTADADALVADIVLLADNLAELNTIADAISDIQTVADDLNEATSEIEVVAGAIANVNTVGSNISNVNTVAGVSSNVTTVAGVAANVTTVAGISSAVSGVAAISSAVSAVNSNASNINTVAGNNTNVSTVAGVSSAVTTVAGISSAVSTVAADGTDIGVVAGISADVQAVADIAADVAAVENIAANVTTVAGISANVTTVAGVSSAVSTVAGVSSAVSTVSGISANVTTVAGISSAVSTVATNNTNVSTVATNISAVNTVAGDIAQIITTANDLNEAVSEIETVANNISAVNTVGTAIADVSAVAAVAADVAIAADNVADIQNFADVYQGASSTAPTTRNDTSALQVGDLYFNTTDDQMKVYGGSGWQSVGSTVNGTSQRYRYIATASQTTFTGSDSNGNSLAYDVGFIDVYLNGVRLDQTDYTATSGDSVVLASGAAASDEINIVTYGNFELADHYNKTDSDSRYQPIDAQLTTLAGASADRATFLASDQAFSMRNRIINGAMVIDQRNAGAQISADNAVFGVDRFQMLASVSSKLNVQQNAGSVTPPAGFSNYLGFTSTSAYSVGASEIFAVNQKIEGFNTADLAWGTASAQSVTLSFWVRSSLTGTFSGMLFNSAANRSYVFSYTISAANTWEQKSVTIAGDTTGTWLTNNGIGIRVFWTLAAGSSMTGSAGSWVASDKYGVTGTTSVVGTNGATFYITGVQLEAGTVASPFERRDYGRELMMCQRYYFKTFPNTTAPAQNAGTGGSVLVVPAGSGAGWMFFNLFMPVQMRTAPTVTTFNPSAANANWSNSAVAQVADTTDARILLNNSSGGSAGTSGYLHVTASAEL